MSPGATVSWPPRHSLPRLTSGSLLKGAAASARNRASLVSVYFDTNKLKLRREGSRAEKERADAFARTLAPVMHELRDLSARAVLINA